MGAVNFLYFSLLLSSLISRFYIVSADRTVVHLAVIVPYDSNYPFSMKLVMPAINLAVETVERIGILPGHRLRVSYADSKCSNTAGPLAAIDFLLQGTADVFLGPVCDYAVAPVARYSPHWDIPVLTTGALVDDFDDKEEYALLTRVLGSYSHTADSLLSSVAAYFHWRRFGLIYDINRGDNSPKGKSDCFFLMKALHKKIKEKHWGETVWYKAIDQNEQQNINYTDVLLEASKHARVLFLCGAGDTVRDIMLHAHDLQLDRGEYSFLDVDLFNSKQDVSEKPWHRADDPDERNHKARLAYEALMTWTPKKPTGAQYRDLSETVKRRAKEQYDFEIADTEVNRHAGAFHDAVMLYGLALNKTLSANGLVSDGAEITKRMWNVTFNGVTGVVSIDDNGDRLSDYSLLDMSPTTGDFQVVGNYYGRSKNYEPSAGKAIHWPRNYDDPPPDTPRCGFDTPTCPPPVTDEDRSETEKDVAISPYYLAESCGECHGMGGAWCTDFPFVEPRCADADDLASNGCNAIEHRIPELYIMVNRALTPRVPASPQKVMATLNEGKSITIPVELLVPDGISKLSLRVTGTPEAKAQLSSEASCSYFGTAGQRRKKSYLDCNGLEAGSTVVVDVTVTRTSCDGPEERRLKLIDRERKIILMKIAVRKFCQPQCDCERYEMVLPSARECSDWGTLTCGACVCDEGHYGAHCECDVTGPPDPNVCRRPNSTNDIICSGRGECVCGQCHCFERRAHTGQTYTGRYCQCDDYSCSYANNLLCGGHGVCDCGVCRCDEGYSGEACDCPTSSETCVSDNWLICNGVGSCVCGRCQCDPEFSYTGPTCEFCPTCPGWCSRYHDCALCYGFHTGPLSRRECDEQCREQPNLRLEMVDTADVPGRLCQFQMEEDECLFRFTYDVKDNDDVVVRVVRVKECP